jgi:hypothetical protein
MTSPVFETVYAVSLFLSLNSLLLWKKRRDRNARIRRERLIARLQESDPPVANPDTQSYGLASLETPEVTQRISS